MVSYLERIGIEPVRVREPNYWYLSPLRSEKTPSFKVNRRLNLWYDFGEGKGGNLIDFGIRYHQCSVADFLNAFKADLLLLAAAPAHTARVQPPQNRIKILEENQLQRPALLSYLTQRCIDIDLARMHCRQVHYELSGKTYYAIGFANDSGGYELRSPYSKISSSPKDMTTIGRGSDVLRVFEGFFDFLSYRTMHRDAHRGPENYLVLNSAAFFSKARPVIESHRQVHLYLDLDQTGKNLTSRALADNKHLIDESGLYQGFKDLNEYLIATSGKGRDSPRQTLGLDLSI
ncbi:toprim domain-containing protein [Dyadobacter sp. MSC1_007]